jgi:hypothetical protein
MHYFDELGGPISTYLWNINPKAIFRMQYHTTTGIDSEIVDIAKMGMIELTMIDLIIDFGKIKEIQILTSIQAK